MNRTTSLFSIRTFIIVTIFIVLAPSLPLIISRRWDWWEAWAYAIISILGFVFSRFLASRKNPDLLVERSEYLQHENTQSWDKILSPISGVGGVLMVIIAGLDSLYGWSPDFNLSIKFFSFALFIAGYALGSYALIANKFFSGTVRLQVDRGHHVITSGPYRWIRHPGYASALLTYLVTPILLDSFWIFIPVFLVSITLIVRTSLEDRFLKENLDGYKEYSQKVRYRLIPWIW
ncbi:isoprenylcysteine carboxylmethyltransferase family protein [Chloroflexota bacterium]